MWQRQPRKAIQLFVTCLHSVLLLCLAVRKLRKVESHCSHSIHILYPTVFLFATSCLLNCRAICAHTQFFCSLLEMPDLWTPILLVPCSELCCLVCSIILGVIYSVHQLYIILNLASLGPIHPSKSALILAKSHCCYHITASSTLWTASCLSSSGQMLSSLVPTLPVRVCWPSGWKLWKELLVVRSVLQSHSQKWFLPVRVAVSLENGLGR